MATRNVVLTEDMDAFLAQLVAAGRYQNASEAVRAGLRLLQDEETQQTEIRARLGAALAEARDGARAEGNGAEAVKRAFDRARQARSDG
ncbi:type II toxin-antitoxin system ParD family antitoxin [Sagittula salina]|uniref:Type II toxin-antitoxin system ParD family antitoxin n=1 Tax=Sagittula salina TaxID=2820268 RepID=A0A940MY45_9RHOB|nr:type II toxin-antitoxin system ParD family antitoxin [Sagittula salina]MBP0484964.1 type II toxin-antitoxin system ParD family antitoxin [Sagittula salina]